jgi:hypothetical protein
MPTKQRKRVAAIITEYWEISHADVILTKIIEGFTMDGRKYISSIEIVTMYVDKFPENDMSRSISLKHNIPIYGSIREALLNGGNTFDLDGIIIIGEHGDYPINEYGQILYPRRRFFEECLNVMLEFDRIVPVYSDKAFAIEKDDIEWVYNQIKKHEIPFFSSSVLPYARQFPGVLAPPDGAPIYKVFTFEMWGGYQPVHPAVDYPAYRVFEHGVDFANYHRLEMIQSIVEKRAYGESGVKSVRAFEGENAVKKTMGQTWYELYKSLGMFINLADVDTFPYTLERPVFFEVEYVDGLMLGILCTYREIKENAVAYQTHEGSVPYCTEYITTPSRKPYIYFGRLVLLIERFIHTSRPPFPVERSLITAGTSDAMMKALKLKKEIETPYLHVRY